jgi:hypothetical protein
VLGPPVLRCTCGADLAEPSECGCEIDGNGDCICDDGEPYPASTCDPL